MSFCSTSTTLEHEAHPAIDASKEALLVCDKTGRERRQVSFGFERLAA